MSNKFQNLRNRPFLIVNTITRPAKSGLNPNKHIDTAVKGWAANPNNWTIFESPFVADRVSNKAMREATVIIDIMKGDIIKNRFDDASDEDVINHYLTKYKEHATRAVDVWLSREAQKFVANGGLNQPAETTEAVEAAPEAAAVTSAEG